MIPKIIHYCWFGYNKKSRLILKCINSWKRLCPDYQIIEWNEEKFDVNCCLYTKEAYLQKKWAYVSDYVRFYVLNQYGGVYLDTDVQLIKPIEQLIKKGKFLGFAREDIVATGLIMATKANDWLCQEVLKTYEKETFEWTSPEEIVAIGRRVTAILVGHGLKCNGKLQEVCDYTIYPKYYFNPTDGDKYIKIDERAYSVHHYAATWFPTHKRISNTIKRYIGQKNLKIYYKIKNRIKRT